MLIPTFNNEKTLSRVLSQVQGETSHILVINDGSTDSTSKILDNFPEIEILHLPKNRGKGNALKKGFQLAGKRGYRFAITIDSDGQHFVEDFQYFFNELDANAGKDIMLIGERDMNSPGVPPQNNFGNRFCSFWFWVETGTMLNDTQCGLRLYPLEAVNSIQLFTPKFEFEIEVIVKLAWRGIPVKNIPVKVLYDPDERVTHFRPFTDIVRITLLNIWFVFVSFIYAKPKNKIKSIKVKGGKRFWRDDVLKINETPSKKAKAVTLGIFIGLSPFWGLQSLLVFFLAYFLKLNRVLAFFFSNISIPPFIPFIIYAGYWLGGRLTGGETDLIVNFKNVENMKDALFGMKQYLIGSFALAALTALCFGVLFYFIFLFFFNKDQNKE